MNPAALSAFVAFLLVASPIIAAPVEPGAIRVVDGDTIKAHGKTYRLVNFDTPETFFARCTGERALGHQATQRLRSIVAQGGLDLTEVECNCPRSTLGTPRCNRGRSCGVLKSKGRDVGDILISAGLARPFVCQGTKCPRQESWCE